MEALRKSFCTSYIGFLYRTSCRWKHRLIMEDQIKTEIPRINCISRKLFVENFLDLGNPVIITGAIDDSPARLWTLDYLVEKVGRNKVNVRTNTSCEDYKLGKKYNIRETTFEEYVKDLKKNNKRAQNSYLAVQNIKKALPEISSEFDVPVYVEKVHGGPYLWIAHQGHYEYCHFDPDDGLLIMLQGRKNVRLYECDVDPLYPNSLGSKGRTIQSQVNCDNPDYECHPKFKNMRCHYGTLQPGEMLYIPAFWWHQVTSIDLAISINIFWGNGGVNKYLTKVMNPPVYNAFSHWLLNIIEQNRPLPSFNKILGRLPEAIYHFIMNQWHEEASDEQLNILVKLIMDYLEIKELPEDKNTGRNPTRLSIRGLLWRS